MPSWKKVIVSGSDASLSSLNVATSLTASIISASSGITGSLFGTSSWAQNSLTSSFITPTGTNAFVQGGNSFGATALLGTNDTQDLQFETNGSVRMTISSSGNVGIGTTTPSTTLQVAGTSSLQNIVFDTNSTYDIGTISTRVRNIWSNGSIVGVSGIFNNLTTYFTASIGGGASGFTPSAILHVSGASNSNLLRVSSPTQTNILFVSGSGNVGIGTTTPSRALEIVNSSAPQLRIRDGVSGGNLDLQSSGDGEARITWGGNGYVAAEASALRVLAQGAAGLWLETNAATKPVEIKPNGTTRLIVSASGNVGIGTTTPTTTLNVNGTTLLQGGQTTVRGSGATSATTALRVENSNQTPSLVVLDNGNVGIGTTTPSASLHIEGNLQISTGSLYTYGQNTDIDSGSIRTVMSVSTGSYRAAFFDYVLNKSTNARAGIVFSVWNGTSVEWNDVSTNDIGNTTEVNLSVGLSGANVILYASSSTNDWSVKALARML